MSIGAWMMLLVMALALGSLAYLLFSTARSIRNERSRHRSIAREFGLSLSLMALFFVTWGAQAISEWQVFTDEQREHGQQPELGDFAATFGQSTLENWQSEFLQLFSFVVLAALFIHKGSAESKDSDEKIEAALRRIEESLGTLPESAPTDAGERWKLPETPLEIADEDLRSSSKSELYKAAQERDVPGRSSMSRDELQQALDDT